MQLLYAYRLNRLFTKSVYGVIRISNSTLAINCNMVRCLCMKPIKQSISQDSVQNLKNPTWTPFYHFPMINVLRYVNRFKLYQSAFTILLMPVSVGFYCYDMSNIAQVTTVTGAAIFTSITLYIITSFFRRLIGAMFVDENCKNVRIAHLTFWGNRMSITVPIEDIIPLTDDNAHVSDAFVKLHRYNSEETLYFTLKFGKILDREIFEKVFGDLEILGLKK